eukprot:361792-Chlamydomonas_euryale.AAC.1
MMLGRAPATAPAAAPAAAAAAVRAALVVCWRLWLWLEAAARCGCCSCCIRCAGRSARRARLRRERRRPPRVPPVTTTAAAGAAWAGAQACADAGNVGRSRWVWMQADDPNGAGRAASRQRSCPAPAPATPVPRRSGKRRCCGGQGCGSRRAELTPGQPVRPAWCVNAGYQRATGDLAAKRVPSQACEAFAWNGVRAAVKSGQQF